jgi:hypothetical protein
MFEARGDHRLANEASLVDIVKSDELLDGNVALQLQIVGASDTAETTAAMLAEDAVAAAVS